MSQPIASLGEADWRRAIEPFVGSSARRASFQLITTLGLLALSMWGIHALLPHSLPLALLLTVPTVGMLVRTFIFMHDCAHGSFFASRRWNDATVAPRIPNYRLQSCHDANPLFDASPVVTLRSGMAALHLALWDEDGGRLIRFRDLPVVQDEMSHA